MEATVGETESRRWVDKAWNVLVSIVGFLLISACSILWGKLTSMEERIRPLEVRDGVNSEKFAQMKKDIEEIKGDVKVLLKR
jgi:hypothetical protein